jgi:hypothetical protein
MDIGYWWTVDGQSLTAVALIAEGLIVEASRLLVKGERACYCKLTDTIVLRLTRMSVLDNRVLDNRGLDNRVLDSRRLDNRGLDNRGLRSRGLDRHWLIAVNSALTFSLHISIVHGCQSTLHEYQSTVHGY